MDEYPLIHEERTTASLVRSQFQDQDQDSESRDTNTNLASSVLAPIDASKPRTPWDGGRQSTATLTQSVPYGSSPPEVPNHDGSTGASPPDLRMVFDEVHGGFSQTSPKTSPTMPHRRPVRPVNGYQSFGNYMDSPPERPRHGNSPLNDPYHPPPHYPQAHFYKAPKIDMGNLHPQESQKPPRSRTFYSFDTLSSGTRRTDIATKTVLTCGYYGSLDIFNVTGRRLSHWATLDRLGGRVLEAKILPWSGNKDPRVEIRPLIALVLHGSCVNTRKTEDVRPGSAHSDNSSLGASESMVHALDNTVMQPDGLEDHQTTVEIYSLRTMSHVATLLHRPHMKSDPKENPESDPPASANLRIQASGRFIAVGSGVSGEVFLFECINTWDQDSKISFRCIGKVWTRTSAKRDRSSSVSSSASDAEPGNEVVTLPKRSATFPLFSLSHRWLAVVPPPSSSGTTLHFRTEHVESVQRAPGLSSHASPSEPHVTCSLDTPDAESTFNKVARDLTQEVFKGAQWLGTQGLQAWNTYWTKPGDKGLGAARELDKSRAPTSMLHDLPPTHANDHIQARKNDKRLVALLDLSRLAQTQHIRPDRALQPIAAFSPPYGCSFVSFAPNGLHILVSSKKGDVHQVWDLMGMIHGHAPPGVDEAVPLVRELVRFTRMTVAKVIEVAWTEPNGDRLAIVTEKGTAHIYDVPASAFYWPPPRRKARPASAPSSQTAAEAEDDISSPGSAGDNTIGARVSAVASRTQPFFSAVRGRPMSVGSAFPGFSNLGFPTNAGLKGGKVMAAGLRQSVGAAAGTVSTFRHLGENRISLPGVDEGISHRCISWLHNKHARLAAQGGGILKIHNVHQSSGKKPAKRRPSVLGSRPLELTVPHTIGSANRRPFSPPRLEQHHVGPTRPVRRGSLGQANPSHDVAPRSHPLSFAEIESNAPYQPFHTDPRVSFHVFKEEASSDSLVTGGRWVFGEAIPCCRVSIGTWSKHRTTPAGDEIPTAMESSINYEGNIEEGQQIVVSTRRRRLREGEAEEGEGEGEFFDDDCAVVDFADSRV